MEIIIGRQGTQKFPITDPTVSRKHCKVTDNGDGTFLIENLSPSGTKVNGQAILRTSAKPDARIQLGSSFSATLRDLIGKPPSTDSVAIQTSNSTMTKERLSNNQYIQEKKKQEPIIYDISHLRRVWDEFNNTNLALAEKQRKINLTRTGLGIFTMCAMPTIFFFGPVGYALTGIGILGNIYSFIGMSNSETHEDKQRRQYAFDDAWVCPNPECGHSLNAKNYRYLKRNFQSCPYCKCRYVEK